MRNFINDQWLVVAATFRIFSERSIVIKIKKENGKRLSITELLNNTCQFMPQPFWTTVIKICVKVVPFNLRTVSYGDNFSFSFNFPYIKYFTCFHMICPWTSLQSWSRQPCMQKNTLEGNLKAKVFIFVFFYICFLKL